MPTTNRAGRATPWKHIVSRVAAVWRCATWLAAAGLLVAVQKRLP